MVLLHRETCEQYFLKEMNFTQQSTYEKQLRSYHDKKRIPHSENILNLVKIWAKEFRNFCSDSYKIYAVYEFPEITLQAEIQSRR